MRRRAAPHAADESTDHAEHHEGGATDHRHEHRQTLLPSPKPRWGWCPKVVRAAAVVAVLVRCVLLERHRRRRYPPSRRRPPRRRLVEQASVDRADAPTASLDGMMLTSTTILRRRDEDDVRRLDAGEGRREVGLEGCRVERLDGGTQRDDACDDRLICRVGAGGWHDRRDWWRRRHRRRAGMGGDGTRGERGVYERCEHLAGRVLCCVNAGHLARARDRSTSLSTPRLNEAPPCRSSIRSEGRRQRRLLLLLPLSG